MYSIKKIKIRNSFVLFTILFPLFIIIGKVIRFYYMNALDFHPTSNVLMGLMNGSYLADNYDQTMNNVAKLYKFLNVFKLDSFLQLEIYISIVFNIIYYCFLFVEKRKLDNLDFFQFFALALISVFLNSYVFVFGKEALVFLWFLALFFTSIYKIKHDFINVLLIVIEAVLMIIFVRTYYTIFLLFFVALLCYFRFFKTVQKKWLFCIGIVITILITYVGTVLVLSNFYNDYYTKMINVSTQEYEQAESMIRPFTLGTSIFDLTLNFITKFIRILFPFELIFSGIKYVPYIVLQLILSMMLLIKICVYKKLLYSEELIILLIISFVLTSSCFEPDYGSWLRHELSITPLFIVFMNFNVNVEFYMKNDDKIKSFNMLYGE